MRRLANWSRAKSSSSTPLTPEAVKRLLVQEWPESDALRDLICHEISAKHTIVSSVVPSNALRPGGYISGPFQFTLADLGMWVTTWGSSGFEPMALTSELSIRYLRPAVGSVLWARVDLNAKAGRSLVSTATLWASDGSNLRVSADSKPFIQAVLCGAGEGTYGFTSHLVCGPRKP